MTRPFGPIATQVFYARKIKVTSSCTECQGLLTNYLICIAKTKDLKQKELGRTSSTVLKASVLGVPWGLSGSVATVLSINISAMSTLSIKRRSRYHFTSEKKIKEVIFNSYNCGLQRTWLLFSFYMWFLRMRLLLKCDFLICVKYLISVW